MNLTIISSVLFGHWLSDFVLHKNKFKRKRTKSEWEEIKRIII